MEQNLTLLKELEFLKCTIDKETKVDKNNEFKYKFVFRQILTATGSLLMSFNGGWMAGFTANLFPQLEEDNSTSTIRLDTEQESWIASILPLAMALGCIVGGYPMDKFGRKPTNIFCQIMSIVGWIIVRFSNSYIMLMTGRFFCGLSIGLATPSIAATIAEISAPCYRGILLSMVGLGISGGNFLSHGFGYFMYWTEAALLATALPIFSIITTIFTPESPIWYFKKNKIVEGKNVFFWLRGCSPESKNQLVEILKQIKTPLPDKVIIGNFLKRTKSVTFIKPLLIMTVYFLTNQFAGTNAVVFYSVKIMQKSIPNMNKYICMILIDVIRCTVAILLCFLIKKIRVRVLTMLSGLGTAISLLFLSLFIYLSSKYEDNLIYKNMPLLGMILYTFFISIGLIPLPWNILGEIFAPDTKAIGSALSTFFNFFCFWLIIKTNPSMFETLGTELTFLVYGIITLFGTSLLYCFLPETRNKTLVQIQAEFSQRKSKQIVIDVELNS